MSGCGYAGKCGDVHRQTADCPFTALYGAGNVPGDAWTAFKVFADGACPGGYTAPCPTYDEYYKAVTYMDKGYIHEGEEDWIKADSVLFNAFIFLQLFNEVGRDNPCHVWACHAGKKIWQCCLLKGFWQPHIDQCNGRPGQYPKNDRRRPIAQYHCTDRGGTPSSNLAAITVRHVD